jgi:cysteinyl-tRNA synthetase
VKRGLAIAEIETLVAERRSAREAKEWQRADEIRKGLAAKGVILKDSPTATTWTIA